MTIPRLGGVYVVDVPNSPKMVHSQVTVAPDEWETNRESIIDSLLEYLVPKVGIERAENGVLHVEDTMHGTKIKLVARP